MPQYGSSPDDIAFAVNVLRSGGLVAFPTETVYGLGADAANERAVMTVFSTKGRPADHPLIVHLASAAEMTRWALDIPDVAWRIAERFWPGPLTLILRRAPGVSDAVTGGQDTIGLRVPAHPVALALLKAFGGGIAAPSANRFGCISPTSAAHVLAEFGHSLPCVIDGGRCEIGLESTILDLSGGSPRVLRPGAITPAALNQILNTEFATSTDNVPRVPGSLASHYAPETPLRLLPRAELKAAALALLQRGQTVTVVSSQPAEIHQSACHWLMMPDNAAQYGQSLYALLRDIDKSACDYILIELPPAQMQWEAVNDRLTRAAGKLQREPDSE
jgi:L-threonylcarbamoyladenylate synthase